MKSWVYRRSLNVSLWNGRIFKSSSHHSATPELPLPVHKNVSKIQILYLLDLFTTLDIVYRSFNDMFPSFSVPGVPSVCWFLNLSAQCQPFSWAPHAHARLLTRALLGCPEILGFSVSKTDWWSDLSLPPPCAPFHCLCGCPGQKPSQTTLLCPSHLPTPVPVKDSHFLFLVSTFITWIQTSLPLSSNIRYVSLPLVFSLLSIEHALEKWYFWNAELIVPFPSQQPFSGFFLLQWVRLLDISSVFIGSWPFLLLRPCPLSLAVSHFRAFAPDPLPEFLHRMPLELSILGLPAAPRTHLSPG